MSHRRLFCTRQHREQMEKSNLGNRRNQLWFALCSFFVFWFFLFYFNSSALISSKHKVHSLVSQESNSPLVTEDGVEHLDRTEPVNQLPVTSKETRFFNRSIVKQKGEETGNRVSVKRNGEESIDQPPLTENGVLPINQTSLTENGSNPEQRFTEKGDDEIVKRPSEAEPVENRGEPVNQLSITENRAKPNSDPCSGQYVYVHNLPSRFNDDMLKECRTLSEWTDMCRFTSNKGLGPPIDNSQGVFSNKGWYATNQFALEVIFNYRMKQYKCLTNDSSLASAVFVPFYAGLDIARYLWGYNISMRDNTTLDLVKWLAARPEWKVLGGKDHFLVAGRITWDFRRLTDKESDWGNKLMLLPEAKNMSMLVIESSPWHSNDFAIPYPTYFHPSTDSEVVQWQNKMRRLRRRFLFSFVGGQRPNLEESIRGQIIDQCRASRRKCKLLECSSGSNKCYNPSNVMKMFQSSVFCLQPQGDSYTRRSAFDSMLAGCIPVFFHPGSAYVQYTWHLPKNYTKYSVFISENDIREGKVSIEKRLLSIPEKEVRAMREEVIQLIPRLIYADPSSKLETLEDAFDLAIQGVIRRANRARMEIREGINSDADFAEDNSWKYNLFGTVGAHEWDPFFSKKKDASS